MFHETFSVNIEPSDNVLQYDGCKIFELLKNHTTNFHLIGLNQVTINGNKGYAILYTYTLEGILLKEIDIIIPGIKNSFLLSYIAEPEQYSKFSPTLFHMIQSFKFNPAQQQAQTEQNNQTRSQNNISDIKSLLNYTNDAVLALHGNHTSEAKQKIAEDNLAKIQELLKQASPSTIKLTPDEVTGNQTSPQQQNAAPVSPLSAFINLFNSAPNGDKSIPIPPLRLLFGSEK